MSSRRRTAEKIRHLIETEADAVRANASHFNDRRYEAIERFDRFEDLRDEARELKEAAIEQLPELIDQVTAAVEANGGHVYVAEDETDANQYIEGVCESEDAEVLVKSKSMTTEEIEVNETLESIGVDVYETDLGEFVIQLADEEPSHLIGPAIHKTKENIAALFNDVFDPDDPFETAEELTRFARDYLGERIREADIGMTGANFVLAESGTIVIVTNEGNARKSAVTPDTHIAVTGVEKLLPSMNELGPFIELIARTGTGQSIAQYVTLLSPPTDSPTIDFEDPDTPIEGGQDDREFHLVLIDNGRMAMRDDDDLRETLYCIRCGACANSCANFQNVGGHAFGGETYTGGIATGWEAGIYGLESAAEFNDLCTGCSRCVNACPVKIDIPWINTVVRDRINRGKGGSFDFLVEGLTPDADPGGAGLQKRVFGNVDTLARLGSATAPISNWLAGSGPAKALMERVFGIDARRDLPRFRRETLRSWYADRGSRVSDPDRQAVLYPDIYTNHVLVERGQSAVRVLEALGVEVTIPPVTESGRAPLSQGMLETARRNAIGTADLLGDFVDDGYDVVVIEPSDLAMFRRDYEKLLPGDHEPIAANSYELMEYVFGLLENEGQEDVLVPGQGRPLAYHSHCQLRTLGLAVYTEAVFDRLGYDTLSSDVECCGMAGSFGYKSQYYDLSMTVGNELADQLDDPKRQLVASGTSCQEQLDDLLDREARHPVEILDPWTS